MKDVNYRNDSMKYCSSVSGKAKGSRLQWNSLVELRSRIGDGNCSA
jgi:hypothetical protein